MKTLIFRAPRRWVLMGALTVLTGAPAVSQLAGTEAQAQGNGRWDRRNNRNDWNDRNDRIQVITGIVTRDRAGDRFQIRTSWNQVLDVDLVGSAREPRRLSRGDRVEVRGDRDGNRIRATGVRLLSDNTGPNPGGQRDVISGRVTRDFRGDNFQLEADNGRDYVVHVRNDEPRRLSRGDRVQVVGEVRGNAFFATSVRILNNTGNPGNNQVYFSGRVTNVRSGNTITVRADNGRTYQVRSSDQLPWGLRVGTRVRISGTFRSGVVYVNRVSVD